MPQLAPSLDNVLQIPLSFVNIAQKQFVEAQPRNQCFNGGYGNGKTYAGCMKLIILAMTFPNSRWIIGRWRYKDLMQTTCKTFFKICNPELYDKKHGGNWVESRGYLKLINGSEVIFMHFDDLDENSIKSLECNGILLDQAEEIGENIYLHLDSRVGRWDMGDVPEWLLEADPTWPRNTLTNKPLVPQYSLILCNPADEGELHWIWQRFHDDSPEKQLKYPQNYYIEATSRENKALDKQTLDAMESRDELWKARFIDGKWGKSGGTIHNILPDSIIKPDLQWVRNLLRKANLYRAFDHGGTTPACCIWVASFQGQYFVYREYYAAGLIISEHRRNIQDLSGFTDERGNYIQESYALDVADPDIFVKRNQNRGGFWSVAEEYSDRNISDSKPIAWIAADNNEFATRNRIQELLRIDKNQIHPITGDKGAPKIYFIQRTPEWENGCHKTILETKSQKYKLLDTINGKPIFDDARAEGVPDHSYDCLRYFCAIHAMFPKEMARKASPGSFKGAMDRIKALKINGNLRNYGLPAQ